MLVEGKKIRVQRMRVPAKEKRTYALTWFNSGGLTDF